MLRHNFFDFNAMGAIYFPLLWILFLSSALGQQPIATMNTISTAVIPFICSDPNSCLDGITSSPSIGTCVALGKFNLTTTDQGYLLTTPAGTIFFNQTSTAWFLRAVLFGRKCLDMQYSADVLSFSQSLQSICNYYLDVNGLNRCNMMQQDPRCMLDGGVSLHVAVTTALAGDNSSAALNARKSICLCSCASDIIVVYSGILAQWSILNPSLTSKISLLQSMCASNVVRSASAIISEATSVQCATNTLQIYINVSDTVPSGSAITVYGLNAKSSANGIQVQSKPFAIVSSFQWSEAVCPTYCTPSRLCPGQTTCNSSGSGWATGVQRYSRCSPWCEADAVLVIVTNGTFSSANFSVVLENGCIPNQPQPTLKWQ